MPTTEQLLNQVCEHCRSDYVGQFDVDPRPGPTVIAGDLYVDSCCFVRDEIRFLNNGRLIFTPRGGRDGRKGEYCQRYAVVCRKLTIVGGNKPPGFNPCGADDPGTDYKNNNVITWLGRLQSAADGPAHGGAAPTGPSFDINDWSDWGGGNNGRDGGTGQPGAQGNLGGNGQSAPGTLTVVALEVEVIGLTSHLSIDWDGQGGGKGSRGQQGGKGGNGMAGREGGTESSWGSESCTRGAGDGGRGGDGGPGGPGGPGGRGGNAGDIYIISNTANISGSGVLVGGSISYVNDGGSGGGGGRGGPGGERGTPGKKGPRNSPCDAGDPGEQGERGADSSTDGAVGAMGAAARVEYHTVVPHACSDPIPLPIRTGAVSPMLVTRGFATPKTVDVAVAGANLAQVSGATASLAGVAITRRNTSTDTQLDLRLDVAGNSALGPCDLTLLRAFGPPAVLAAALTVQRYEVLAIAPASGARGSAVSVTITGQGFDPAAAVQNVNVSGAGANAINVAVISDTQVQCVIDIGNAAALGARSITVSIGGLSHTLPAAFTVTA
jgi:hypothetical protein